VEHFYPAQLKNINDSVVHYYSAFYMTGMNGLELLKNVKGDPRLKDIPFLIFTSHDDPEKIQEALSLGALEYIVKPLTPEKLHLKIRKILY